MRSNWRKTDVQVEFGGEDYSVDVDGYTFTCQGDVDLIVTDFQVFKMTDGNWVEFKGSTAFLNDVVADKLQGSKEYSMVRV